MEKDDIVSPFFVVWRSIAGVIEPERMQAVVVNPRFGLMSRCNKVRTWRALSLRVGGSG